MRVIAGPMIVLYGVGIGIAWTTTDIVKGQGGSVPFDVLKDIAFAPW
jgi:hypothetical protein